MAVLLLSRTGQSTVYAVAMQPIEDERRVSLSADAGRTALDIGTRRWLLELPGAGGASVQCDDVTWTIGVPGDADAAHRQRSAVVGTRPHRWGDHPRRHAGKPICDARSGGLSAA